MTRSHRLLRTGSALAALSTALALAAPAHAQGLLAGGSVTGGNANAQIFTSPNQTNVLVNANQAIIDWTPTENTGTTAINLLPEGHTLYFDANQGVTDFTVLNRIQPINAPTESLVSRLIEMNGTVQSRVGNGFGGNVWFYTPGGFLLGSTARFDVGGLVLTTNPIDVTGGLLGTNGEIRFRGPAGSAFGVTVNSGAQINALAAGSYVAMVAPSVIMNGRVNVDGSTAYVGAEQADLTINGGLFDIAITVGTSQAHGVEHGGVTTGPASTAADDTQRIAMVAVPKNQAMTMLLSGSIGYMAATDVALEGSAVVLSAGHDIRNGAVWTPSPAGEVGGIAIGTATLSSAVAGQATGTITIDPAAAGTTLFESTANFSAPGGISVSAADGETVRAQQGLSLTSTAGAAGGSITLTADGGVIDVTPGTLGLNARGDGFSGVDATGGTITLSAIGGGRIAAGQIDADAGASAGDSLDATGGTVTLATSLAGVIDTPFTNLRASGDALFSAGEPNPNAGNGVGGTITIRSGAGRLTLGDVNVVAQASGGNASSGQGGSATGGNILVDIAGGTHQWGSLFADVSTAAGYTTQGGNSGGALGGSTGISVGVTGSETTLDIIRSVSLYADGRAFGGGANAGSVRGGAITVATDNGGTLLIGQDLYAQSRGDGSNLNIADDTAATPDVFGGTIGVTVDSGTIRSGALLLYADAAAGFGNVTSGIAQGGTVTVDIASTDAGSGALTLTACPTFGCVISAGARGGSSVAGSDAIGGTIDITSLGGNFSSTGQFYIEANGRGGRSIDGGSGQGANGTGGAISFTNRGTASFGQLFLEANGSASEVAEGFFFGSGSGGVGLGGSARVSQAAGSLTAALLRATADGEGGFAGANCVDCTPNDTPFSAGDGIGGGVAIEATTGAITTGDLAVTTSGPITMAFQGAGALRAAGTATLDSGSDIRFTHSGRPADGDSLFAQQLNITAAGAIIGEAGTRLRSAGAAMLQAGAGNIDLARLTAAGNVDLRAPQGAVTVAENLASGGTVTVAAPLGIDLRALADIDIASAVAEADRAIVIVGDGVVTLANARSGSIRAAAGGALAIANVVTTAGDVLATSSGGAVRVADTAAANSLMIRGPGGVALEGQVRARALADIGTAGAIAVNGQLTGDAVTLTSTDLIIGPNAGILAAHEAPGSSGLLTLNATGSGTTFLGGPANSNGYSLSGTEMATLRARDITINANGAVEIGSFTMAAGANGNIADNGLFAIFSPTTMRVNGEVRINAMPRTAQLQLDAAQRIVVDPATGVIDLRSDGPGELGGTLRMRSNAIYVATDAAIAAIAGLTDPTLIDARMAQNDGIVRPDNIVRAIDIFLDVADGAFIQNLGAGADYDQRRGFLATGSTLSVDTASAGTRVVINGQLLDDSSAAIRLSGLLVAPILSVNGVRTPVAGGRFDQRSTVNGCLMINPASCQRSTIAPEQAALSQSGRDAVDRVLDPNPLLSFAPFLNAAIELRDYVPQAYLPLIDEPVTGAGNDDLWQCNEDRAGCARPNP